jgi:hypothetical protein
VPPGVIPIKFYYLNASPQFNEALISSAYFNQKAFVEVKVRFDFCPAFNKGFRVEAGQMLSQLP